MGNDTFKGVWNINDVGYTEAFERNIVDFIDWALLNVGGYQDVRRGTTTYGPDLTRLSPVKQDSYHTYGKVWQSQRENWVWESGIGIPISGVYVNNTFYASSVTGTYAHRINYRDGQVLFTNAISPSSTVSIEYSYKLYEVRRDTDEWFEQIIRGTWITDNNHFWQVGSGVYDILAKNRINLPVIAVEGVDREDLTPYQQGGGQTISKPFLIYILATEKWQMTVADYLLYQNDKVVDFYNVNRIIASGVFKYNYDGTLNNPKTFRQLSEGYFWKKATFKNAQSEIIANTKPIFIKAIRFDIEADFPEI